MVSGADVAELLAVSTAEYPAVQQHIIPANEALHKAVVFVFSHRTIVLVLIRS